MFKSQCSFFIFSKFVWSKLNYRRRASLTKPEEQIMPHKTLKLLLSFLFYCLLSDKFQIVSIFSVRG